MRATYLYCGMADEAYEYGDDAMFHACRALFRNITDKRMYITGGIGSSSSGEAFTKDYDLPRNRLYRKRAAIGLALFAGGCCGWNPIPYMRTRRNWRFTTVISPASRWTATRFFYENPLEINLLHHGRNPSVKQEEHLPITQRVEVFDCSCCPPNIARLAASVGDFLYTHDDSRLFVPSVYGQHGRLGKRLPKDTDDPVHSISGGRADPVPAGGGRRHDPGRSDSRMVSQLPPHDRTRFGGSSTCKGICLDRCAKRPL